MKDAATWSRQAIEDIVDAARAKGTDLEAGIVARIERRFRAAQLDAISHCAAHCKSVAHEQPRLQQLGATRCVDRLSDLALNLHDQGQVPTDA